MGVFVEVNMDKKARNAAVRFLGAPRDAKVRRFISAPKWAEGWVGTVLVCVFLAALIFRVVDALK